MIALTDLEQSAFIGQRIPLIFLVIALMLLVSFRNLQGMVIPMLTAVLSTVWALGLMGHTGIVIDTWNATVPILLIAIAAAHSAQMLKRYVEEVAAPRRQPGGGDRVDGEDGTGDDRRRLTAALGFASLALFGVRAVAQPRPLVRLRHRQRGAAGDDVHPGAARRCCRRRAGRRPAAAGRRASWRRSSAPSCGGGAAPC